jgi:putative phosphoribosyl transferase
VTLRGLLRLPLDPVGIVLFAHGSGSSRLSPRNAYVAERLGSNGLATLLFDLLTEREEEADELTAQLRFDIPLLTSRLVVATEWTMEQPRLGDVPLGYFGASTGAAAALAAAARIPSISAVVSRGGRPDLAGADLASVRAPTLLIVGGHDREVLELNRKAVERMTCVAQLQVVPGASHLFVEPDALEQVAALAASWFVRHAHSSARRAPQRDEA